MQRNIFLFDNLDRLREFLDPRATSGETENDTALGIGFFACSSATGHGVDLTVAPPFLEGALRGRMVSGQAAPYSREALLFGDEAVFEGAQRNVMSTLSAFTAARAGRNPRSIGVSRWLVVGVHPGVFRANPDTLPAEVWPSEVALSASLGEAVQAFLSAINAKVLGLRPGSLVFLLETGLLGRYFEALSAWKSRDHDDTSWSGFLELDAVGQEEVIGKAVVT